MALQITLKSSWCHFLKEVLGFLMYLFFFYCLWREAVSPSCLHWCARRGIFFPLLSWVKARTFSGRSIHGKVVQRKCWKAATDKGNIWNCFPKEFSGVLASWTQWLWELPGHSQVGTQAGGWTSCLCPCLWGSWFLSLALCCSWHPYKGGAGNYIDCWCHFPHHFTVSIQADL